MPIDTAAVSVSLNSAYALVDALRCALTGSSCPQWTGTGGDSYRLRKDEVVAQAQGVLDDIQAALDAVPTLEANATAFLVSTVAAVANGCNTAVTLADFYGTVLTSTAAAVSDDLLGRR